MAPALAALYSAVSCCALVHVLDLARVSKGGCGARGAGGPSTNSATPADSSPTFSRTLAQAAAAYGPAGMDVRNRALGEPGAEADGPQLEAALRVGPEPLAPPPRKGQRLRFRPSLRAGPRSVKRRDGISQE